MASIEAITLKSEEGGISSPDSSASQCFGCICAGLARNPSNNLNVSARLGGVKKSTEMNVWASVIFADRTSQGKRSVLDDGLNRRFSYLLTKCREGRLHMKFEMHSVRPGFS